MRTLPVDLQWNNILVSESGEKLLYLELTVQVPGSYAGATTQNIVSCAHTNHVTSMFGALLFRWHINLLLCMLCIKRGNVNVEVVMYIYVHVVMQMYIMQMTVNCMIL